jgi:hypothetical protein
MHKKIVAALLSLIMFAVCPAMAAPKDTYTSSSPGPRKQVATIIFAGLAGAVLGLSTLSFYGRPQDKLTNVPVGMAIGIIVGASYTTYKATTSPRDIYGYHEPEAWKQASTRTSTPTAVSGVGYTFTF